jgi:hypothetical protein
MLVLFACFILVAWCWYVVVWWCLGGFFLAWVAAVDGGDHGESDEDSSHSKLMVAAHGVVCVLARYV